MDYKHLQKISAMFDEVYRNAKNTKSPDTEIASCVEKLERDLQKLDTVFSEHEQE